MSGIALRIVAFFEELLCEVRKAGIPLAPFKISSTIRVRGMTFQFYLERQIAIKNQGMINLHAAPYVICFGTFEPTIVLDQPKNTTRPFSRTLHQCFILA